MPPMNRTAAACVLTLVFVAPVWAGTSSAAPARFRDLQLYTTSAPDTAKAGRIVAAMRILNRGATPLDVNLSLDANPAAGFGGSKFHASVDGGKEAAWAFELKPPAEIRRE